MKYKRQGQIIRIIKENKIKTHEQLIEHLKKSGFNVTQATVSRDIKDLGLIKIPDDTGSIYAQAVSAKDTADRINSFADSVRSIESAMHTVVVKTYPGMASAVAASIDDLMKNEFIGSIAGDDTLLIIAHDSDDAQKISEKLRRLFK